MAGKKTTKKAARKHEEDIEMKKAKNAQTWSIDLIVGVIIFMLIIAVFYAFLTSKNEPKLKDVQDDNQAASAKVTNVDVGSLGIVNNGRINMSKYDELCKEPYEEVKAMLGIESDFCIYLEDQYGNIIPCTDGDGHKRAGIGNGQDINVSEDYSCGDII
ncbi:hypothetical protein JXA12_05180 [Candidatus Woesearchaeota archaeon]|nr:hypothetical protein [Candidatus Woesearchaeota archaeon]